MFADDTKNYKDIQSAESKEILQDSIEKLTDWTEKWLLQFNNQKCHVLHLGKCNPNYEYEMGGEGKRHVLQTTMAEKDLGVVIDPLLTFEKHIEEVVKKANKLVGMLSRVITNKDKEIMVPLFKSLVRPVLEYGNVVWSPSLKKHIQLIENVQRRFTKRIKGFKDMEYEERLKSLHLPSLEYRRFRGDMIETFKILKGFYDPITIKDLFTLVEDNTTRGHSLKLKVKQSNTNLSLNFFTNRIVKPWNGLLPETVTAETLNAFKNLLDKEFEENIYKCDIFNQY